MTTTPQRSPYHRRLKDFQLGVATKWIDVAASERTSIFQFVAYFAAFNALYWLWGEVDGRPPSEKERITNLVGKLNPLIPDDEQVKACIRNLRERGPIRDMRKRSDGREEGDEKEGRRLLNLLCGTDP